MGMTSDISARKSLHSFTSLLGLSGTAISNSISSMSLLLSKLGRSSDVKRKLSMPFGLVTDSLVGSVVDSLAGVAVDSMRLE